jgi:hypothetical protein
MRTSRTIAASLLLAAGLNVGGPALAEAEKESPRPTMNKIFEAVSLLLPLSLDEKRFADAANAPKIEEALRSLVRSADALQEHGKRRSEGFGYLSRSLGDDVRLIQSHYTAHRYAEARFLLHLLTDTCFACHSRLPEEQRSRIESHLLERPELAQLSAQERARLEVATRQFDAALASYEKIFADPAIPPAQMDLGGYFVDYLTVAIRVRRDLERPGPPLQRLAARPDTTTYLRRRAEGWVESLAELRKGGGLRPGLETARAWIEKARSMSEFPSDHDGLVYDLAASSALHQFVESAPRDQKAALSEAYYLLGVTEARSRRNYWVSETELYLEAAIRANPGSGFAHDAYDLLEEFTVFGYTGSAGENVPPDVQAKLDELRSLAYAP